MREVMDAIVSAYKLFFGDGIYGALFIISIIYFIVREKERKLKVFFLGFLVIFGIIYVCPVTAYIIMEYCIGRLVYWRMFWLLPVTVMIAYVFTRELCENGKGWKKYVIAIGLVAALIQGGVLVYNGNFQPRENRYKISSNVIMVCDAVNEDAAAHEIEERGLIAANELVSQIRQYDAGIRMPYGRNALKGERLKRRAKTIFSIMSAEVLDAKALAYHAKMGNYQYLAYPTGWYQTELLEAGYMLVTGAGSYDIYRLSEDAYNKKDILVTQYGEENGKQSTCYTIQDNRRRLVVIDGGWKEDSETVRERIRALGGRVDAWILTHPHEAHIGAFTEIYKNPEGIVIDEVYVADMPSLELCAENAPWDDMTAYEEFLALGMKDMKIVSAGTRIDCGNIHIKILSAYEDTIDELSNDLLHDGSMLFLLEGRKEKMLFCADVGERLSGYLLERYGKKLDCEYLQMSHHGNGGLSEDFYRQVSPQIAFFDAPNELFYDVSKRYTSETNRKLMQDMGCEMFSFETAPNTIVVK